MSSFRLFVFFSLSSSWDFVIPFLFSSRVMEIICKVSKSQMCSRNYYNLCGCGGVSRFVFQSFRMKSKLLLILERFTLLGSNIAYLLALWRIVPWLKFPCAKCNEDQSGGDVCASQNPENNLPLMVGIL